MSRDERRRNRGFVPDNVPLLNNLNINDYLLNRANINVVRENVQSPRRNNGRRSNGGDRRESYSEQNLSGRNTPPFLNTSNRRSAFPPQISGNNQSGTGSAPPIDSEQQPQHPRTPRGPPPQSFNIRILSGSIAQIIEWADHIQGNPIFEVTGILIAVGVANSCYPPAPGNELNLLLRDRKEIGPVLQVIQPYHLFPDVPREIETGMRIRCIGKILDTRRMLAVKIAVVPPEDVNDYNRVSHVCRFTS